ncbi:MAG: hypothetical protein IBX47_03995 [Desulfuromonadales bacterium]|nr:hypothetical protein [Desulfuromonadales bacterium]
MNRLLILLITLLFANPALAASPAAQRELKDLFFGEALYHAYQGEWFDAIARLDTELTLFHALDEPELDSLYSHLGQAEFDVGDFELAYRMHQRAGRAITAVIEGDVEQTVRNRAIYRLARIYFQKGQPVNALQALDRLRGETPADLVDNLLFLRAEVLMADSRFNEAVPFLENLQGAKSLAGFAPYNLGIALIDDDREEEGRQWLDRAGQIEVRDSATAAIRDKANLVLGEMLLEEKNFEAAKLIFDRVRLSGPFSDRALLGSGWADAYRGRFDLALVPWSILAEGEITDPSVQEVMLAVPYAYGRLGLYSNAALMYGRALEVFSIEINKLDVSTQSILDGKFLAALVREELKQDANWVVTLRELPDAPETYYLLDMMASNDFQEYLKNYLDLKEIRRKLERWQDDLNAYAEIIAVRRAYYEPLLPEIDRAFQKLDARMRSCLQQRDRIVKRLQTMLLMPRPDALATAAERIIAAQLTRLEQTVAASGQKVDNAISARIKRLRGLLLWSLQTGYDQRLTEAYTDLQELNQKIDVLGRQYTAFVRSRQTAIQSYQGYDETIRLQQVRIEEALIKVQELMAEQGNRLEIMAVNELTLRRERLEELRVKARFAMADSYDRASRVQEKRGVKP